jgi:hypothetical protein
MDEFKELMDMIKDRYTLVQAHKAADVKLFDDCYNGQFNRGRAAAEQNEIEWLTKVLETFK